MNRDMSDEPLYTRAQLGRLAAVPDDVLAFWLRYDLVRSIDLGPRKHRRFDAFEVKIAAFLREARNSGMNVSALRALTTALRDAADVFKQYPYGYDELMHADDLQEGASFEDAFRSYLTNAEWQERAPNLIAHAQALHAGFDFSRKDDWMLGKSFLESDGVMLAWLSADGSWEVYNRLPQDDKMPAATVIVFDFSMFAPIEWSAIDQPETL